IVLPLSLQGSLPAGWLAFTGRESNPQDRYKRFQVAVSSSFSGFILAQGKFHFEPPFTSFDHLVGAAGYGLYVFAPAGRRTVKTEPLPGSLFTVTSPPIMRASLRERARPSPVPPKR